MEHSFLELVQYKSMNHSFHEIGQKYSHTKESINILIRLLPDSLKFQFSKKYPDEEQLYYQFAAPYKNLNHNGIVYGGSQIIKLEVLYLSMYFANKYFTNNQIIQFRNKLGNPESHFDQVFEFRPFLFANKFDYVNYEVPGNDSKTIDWEIIKNKRKVLFEIKSRHDTSISNYNKIITRDEISESSIGMPETDSEKFFKDIENKFNERNSDILQGAWIGSSSTENRRVIEDYLEKKINNRKIQFLIVSGFENDATLFVNDSKDKSFLIDLFNIIETQQHVF